MLLQYLLLLDIVISVLLTPVKSVKTCYFCADYSHVCRKNDRAIEPMRMYCESFLLNRNEPLGKHFRQPSQVKYLAEDLFAVALEHKNVKTLCMTLRYKFASNWGTWNLTMVGDVSFQHNQTDNMTLQACMYQSLVHYRNACDYFTRDVFQEGQFKIFDCSLCKRHDCNSTAALPGGQLSVFALVIALLRFFIFR
ncbi:unnamed protein product [Tenebrio molitor]|nr:unnamed protein product [Tenebrio molitor]